MLGFLKEELGFVLVSVKLSVAQKCNLLVGSVLAL